MKVISHARIDSDGVDSAYQKATTRIDKIVKRLEEPLDPKRFQQPNPDAEIGPVTSNRSQKEHEDAVSKAREYIADGECIQIVVSQRFSKKTNASPFDIYRSFRALNPSPYMYHLDLVDFHIIGTSPELLVRVEEGTIESRPIAGTIRRGETEEELVELVNRYEKYGRDGWDKLYTVNNFWVKDKDYKINGIVHKNRIRMMYTYVLLHTYSLIHNYTYAFFYTEIMK